MLSSDVEGKPEIHIQAQRTQNFKIKTIRRGVHSAEQRPSLLQHAISVN